MLNWLKNMLGVTSAETKQEPLVLENLIIEAPVEETKKTTKPKTRKSPTKKAPVETTEAPKKRGRKPKAVS